MPKNPRIRTLMDSQHVKLSERLLNKAISYRLQKAGLLKCLKSPLPEHLWAVNMLNGPKDCLNLHGSVFVILFDLSEEKLAQKTLF